MNLGTMELGNIGDRWEAVGPIPDIWKNLQLKWYRSPFLQGFSTGGHFAPIPNLQTIFGKEGRKTFLVVRTEACSIIWWVEVRDATKHLTTHRIVSTTKNYLCIKYRGWDSLPHWKKKQEVWGLPWSRWVGCRHPMTPMLASITFQIW